MLSTNVFTDHIYSICIHNQNLDLNNLDNLICYKTHLIVVAPERLTNENADTDIR